MSSREEQSPTSLKWNPLIFHMILTTWGSQVRALLCCTNSVSKQIWYVFETALGCFFIISWVLAFSRLLTKEVQDLTWENSPYYSSLDFGQSEAWDEPSRLEFPVANQLGFRAETLRINIRELIWNPQTSRGRSKYFSFILTLNLKKLTCQTFSVVVVDFLGIEPSIPCLLNKHSTTAPVSSSIWGREGGGMRWRVGTEAELVSLYGSGWAGTWDVLPLPPVLRLQACTPTLKSQVSSL